MFKYKLTTTGVPHLILFFVIAGFLMIIEASLYAKVKEQPAVSISSDIDNNFERASIVKLKKDDTSKEVTELINKLINNDDDFSEIEKNSIVKLLTKKEKQSLYSGLARKSAAKHDYASVIKVLKELSFHERTAHQVQFIYAYSLSMRSKLPSAIQEYQLFIKKSPLSQAGSLNLGLLLKKTKRCSEAIPLFEKASSISSGTKKAKSLSGLASCHYTLGEYEQAVKYYKKSIEYRPDSALTWSKLGEAISQSKQNYDLAIDAYNKGIALDAQNFKPYLHKAKFQMKYFNYINAVSTLKKAQSLSNSHIIHETMIWSFIEQGKRNKARKYLAYLSKGTLSKRQKKRAGLLALYVNKEYQKLLLELKKNKYLPEDLLYLKGLTSRKMGFYKSAISIFKQLAESKKFGLRSEVQVARISRSRKQYDKSLGHYENLMKHNNNAGFVWFEAALAHEKKIEALQGLNKINEAVKLNPNNQTYKLAQARLLKMSGQLTTALSVTDSILDKQKHYVRALRLKSVLLAEMQETEKLIDTYNLLLTINQNDYDITKKLVGALISKGDIEQAQSILVRVLEEQSDNVNARFILARSYYRSNQLTKSLSEIENLLRLDKKHQQAMLLKDSIITGKDRNNNYVN